MWKKTTSGILLLTQIVRVWLLTHVTVLFILFGSQCSTSSWELPWMTLLNVRRAGSRICNNHLWVYLIYKTFGAKLKRVLSPFYEEEGRDSLEQSPECWKSKMWYPDMVKRNHLKISATKAGVCVPTSFESINLFLLSFHFELFLHFPSCYPCTTILAASYRRPNLFSQRTEHPALLFLHFILFILAQEETLCFWHFTLICCF